MNIRKRIGQFNPIVNGSVAKTYASRPVSLFSKSGNIAIILFFMIFSGSVFGQESSQKSNVKIVSTDISVIGSGEHQLLHFAPEELSSGSRESLNRIISVDFRNTPMLSAFEEIASIAGLEIAYSEDISETIWDQPITVYYERATILGALYAVLGESNLKLTLSPGKEKDYIVIVDDSGNSGRLKNPPPPQQETGHIEGYIMDSQSGDPLIGATVSLPGTAIGTSTNTEGYYRIRNLPAGDLVLRVAYLGYHTQEIEVDIIGNESVTYDIMLEEDVVLGDEVIVHSQALAQAQAIRLQLASNTIVNVVSESRLRELPDANAAEAVGRLPGVSVIRSAGEANKVAIRGLGPQYNSVTIDGDRVAGTGLNDREVDMSMISPEMLSGIELYKVLRPDMDADAVGGTVNFTFARIPDKNRFRLNFSSGYHGHINGVGTYKGSASASSRFFKDRLGVLGTVTSERVDRSSHVFGATYHVIRSAREGEPHAPIETSTIDLTDRIEDRQRHGLGLTLDFTIPSGRIYSNNFFSRLNRDEYSLRRRIDVESNLQDWTHRDRDIRIDIMTNSLGGEHALWGGIFNIDWRISHNMSDQEHPYDNEVRFRERNALNRDIYYVGMPPDELPTAMHDNVDETALSALDHRIHNSGERDLRSSVDFTVPVRFGRVLSGDVKLGGRYFQKNRFRESRGWAALDYQLVSGYPTFDIINNEHFPTDRANNGHPSIRPFAEFNPYNILDGGYDILFDFDRSYTNMMWDRSGDLYYHRTSTRLNDYDATESVSAGYIMAELDIGDRLMLLPGIRYEHETGEYDAVRKDFVEVWAWGDDEWRAHEDRLEDVTANIEEGMWFPMVQARYRVIDGFDIRAARTVSTSRPSYRQRSPRRVINPNARTISRGQPDLVSARSVNYDVIMTLYGNRVGLFSIGGFYKEIDDLIYDRQTVVMDPEAMDIPAGNQGFTIFEPKNNPNVTKVRGIEAEWQSNFRWLPYPFNGLVLNANIARIHSETHYPGFRTERTPQGIAVIDTHRVAPMVHQPDYVANVSIGYDYRGFSARASMMYQGSVLTSVSGTRPELDRYTEDYLRWDLAFKQNLIDGLASVFLNVQNLTNRRDYSIQFADAYPRSMEYYGLIVDAGIRFQF